ncbi:serine hydrolase [Streptomyces sp. NPDC058953]|uniref:serine hydrolase n=1 Tax=Streptomyces sp. NPDC058953 TaxID=3346676 RepID=UPI0036BDB0BC
MAGESPDKSEQRKSSGATTTGEHDPRLAVSAVRVDEPTAVFTLPPEPDADEADDTDNAESADGTGDTGDTGKRVAGSDEADATDADADAEGDRGGDGDEEERDAEAEAVAAGRRVLAAAADSPTAEVTAVFPEPPLSASEAPPRAPEAPPAAEGAPEAPEASEGAPSASRADAKSDTEGEEPGAGSGEIPGVRGDTDDADDTDDASDSAAGTDKNDHNSNSGKDEKDAEDTEDAEAHGDDVEHADADADKKTDAAEGEGKEADEADKADKKDGEDGEGEGQDTPTAVFTPLRKRSAAVPAPSPAGDSPTTALKLPPAPRPESDPVDTGKGRGSEAGDDGKDSESRQGDRDGDGDGAKKASTFVPLRSTDQKPPAPAGPAVREPAPGKAPEAAPAPAAPAAPAPAAPLAEAELTRQQPVPPLPPMDLLAELTNTPPTPMRKVARRFKIWTPLVVLLAVVGAVAQIMRPLPAPALELSAKPTFTFKGAKLTLPFPTDGQGAVAVEGVGTIGTYGSQAVAPTASVAKAMTAYVILRDRPLKEGEEGPRITIDHQAAKESGNWENESVARVSEGQKYSLKQLLQLTMIKSGNNTARLLARWNAGSEAAFVKKMNDAAKDLGMHDTVYTDPSGFKKTTVSTPADQLKLAEAVMNNKVLRDITNTTNVDIPGSEPIRNGNDRALLLDGVDGIKTGSSTPAGGNLLWSFVKEIGGTYYRINGIAMNAGDGDSPYQKTQKAIDYSVKMIEATRTGMAGATVVKKGQAVGYLDNGLGGRVPVVATRDLKAIGWGGLEIKLELSMGKGDLPRSGNAGDVIGELSVLSGPAKETVPVALRENLAEPGVVDKLTRLG